MWLNEAVFQRAAAAMSKNESIRTEQIEAWEEWMDNGETQTTSLIQQGMDDLKRYVGGELYQAGDLIQMMDPDDACSPQLMLLIDFDNSRCGWNTLLDGEMRFIPLQLFIKEDHWKLE